MPLIRYLSLHNSAVTAGVIVLTFLFIILLPWYPLQLMAGLLLSAFLPGHALLAALQLADRPLTWVEHGLLSVALSYGLTIAFLLGLAFAHITLSSLSVAGGLAGLSLLFLIIGWKLEPTNR